ncbi:MarR family winged helix-turn-helix transcriptional regulator [Pseudoalteromonas sp. SSDWG2]|uniref:MarR family winged helix-turn-helix transcriptional regulator n=1 Tax=Pseudoalteromonas sp. SSDWG2 TaxID=3139391 RepID=UPI003BAAD18E
MATFNLETFIPYLMTLTGAKVSEAFADVYQNKLTNPQWRVVCHLVQANTTLTSKQLCDLAMLDKSTASRAISELQNMGWLKIEPCAADKRAKQVRLTSTGKQQFDALVPVAMHWQKVLLEEFNDDEISLLIRCLSKLESKSEEIKKAHQ